MLGVALVRCLVFVLMTVLCLFMLVFFPDFVFALVFVLFVLCTLESLAVGSLVLDICSGSSSSACFWRCCHYYSGFRPGDCDPTVHVFVPMIVVCLTVTLLNLVSVFLLLVFVCCSVVVVLVLDLLLFVVLV